MSDFTHAINLIRKYEGFSEKACADPATDAEPYIIGYGTQYYPDGSPVKKGQLCSPEKALEYLFHEINVIDIELQKLNLGLDAYMHQALISFAHSIGWEPFLYSSIIDCIEQEDYRGATQEISRWIFDEQHQAVGSLINRRREEIRLFLFAVPGIEAWPSTDILLAAFRNYTASLDQVYAIRRLEQETNPYVLAEFANSFKAIDAWDESIQDELDGLFSLPYTEVMFDRQTQNTCIKKMQTGMERSIEPREFELPLELQFSMRKAELASEEMTWEELRYALLNLYHRRLMEWCAVKDLMADEEIEIDWDIPTDIELAELAATCMDMEDDELDDDDDDDLLLQPF